nr:MAG TPA: hypothetical protein [Caudoviricetes sp.]
MFGYSSNTYKIAILCTAAPLTCENLGKTFYFRV